MSDMEDIIKDAAKHGTGIGKITEEGVEHIKREDFYKQMTRDDKIALMNKEYDEGLTVLLDRRPSESGNPAEDGYTLVDILGLINEQQAEIKRLREVLERQLHGRFDNYAEQKAAIKQALENKESD